MPVRLENFLCAVSCTTSDWKLKDTFLLDIKQTPVGSSVMPEEYKVRHSSQRQTITQKLYFSKAAATHGGRNKSATTDFSVTKFWGDELIPDRICLWADRQLPTKFGGKLRMQCLRMSLAKSGPMEFTKAHKIFRFASLLLVLDWAH